MSTPRRWTIADYRQSDEVRAGKGKVVAGDGFRQYGETVRVREDAVTEDDVEDIQAWLRVHPRRTFSDETVRDLLRMVLGRR